MIPTSKKPSASIVTDHGARAATDIERTHHTLAVMLALLHGSVEATLSRTQKDRCKLVFWEPKFRQYMKDIFETPGMLLEGLVVDCGAERGGESCWFADLAPNRTILALEPLPANLRDLETVARFRHNVLALHGGLGSVHRRVNWHMGQHTKSGSMLLNIQKSPTSTSGSPSTFQVYRLDNIFGLENDGTPKDVPPKIVASMGLRPRLAFGHFDVEGGELDLLAGAQRVIKRDRPVFTIEVGSGGAKFEVAHKLLSEMGYLAYTVPEQCGTPKGCRNVLCIPKERPPPDWLVNGTHAGRYP